MLAVLISAPRGPSTIAAHDFEARLRELTAEPEPVTEDLRTRAIRHRLTRRLLDDPVVYYDELSEAELAYLTSQRSALTRRICELTGLVAEMRAEGIAMVDPHDDLTDVRMPEVGTDGHVTLLLAEYLAGRRTTGPAARRASCTRSSAGWPRAPGVLAAEHARAGRRGRARRARAGAARGAAPGPPRRRRRPPAARARALRAGGADAAAGDGDVRVSRLPITGTRALAAAAAGLVDLFYYDAEEFAFRDGRLLLRGNNGTGKSKVLALTLPFLLDGDLSAAPRRAGRRPEQADGVEPAARRRAPERRAARLHLAGVRPARRGRRRRSARSAAA